MGTIYTGNISFIRPETPAINADDRTLSREYQDLFLDVWRRTGGITNGILSNHQFNEGTNTLEYLANNTFTINGTINLNAIWQIGGVTVTATAAELNLLKGAVAPTDGQILVGSSSAGAFRTTTLSISEGLSSTLGNGTLSVTANVASTSIKGVAQFNPAYFTVADGNVSLLSTAYVAGIIGTANQVFANGVANVGIAQTGTVTLTLPQSIGTTNTVQFEKLGIGTAISTSDRQMQIAGNITASAGAARGLLVGGIYTTSGVGDEIYDISTFSTTVSTSFSGGRYYGITARGVTKSGSGSILLAYGFYAFGFSSVATHQFGGFFVTPTGGTSNKALYADNLVVGSSYSLLSPPSGGAMISGDSYFGSSSAIASGGKVQSTRTGWNIVASDGTGTTTAGIYTNSGAATGNQIMFLGYSNHTLGFATNNQNAQMVITPSGQFAQGTASPNSTFFHTLVPTTSFAYAFSLNGSVRGVGGSQDAVGLFIGPSMNGPSSSTAVSCKGVYIAPTFVAGSVATTNFMGVHIDGTGMTGTGTAPAVGYSLYVSNIGYGTVKCATYTENLSVGYTGTSPPSSGGIIAGKLGIGASSVGAGTFVQITPTITTSSSLGVGLLLSGTSASATYSGSSDAVDLVRVSMPSLDTGSGLTGLTLRSLYLSNTSFFAPLGTGTIATGAGIYSASFTIPCTNAYGGFFANPTGGTSSNAAIYTANLSVGFTGVSPPSNGAIFSGVVGVGTSAPATSAGLTINHSSASNPYSLNQLYILGTCRNGSNVNLVALNLVPNIIPGAATTYAYCQDISPTINASSGTITNFYSLAIEGGTLSAGSVTNAYSLAVSNPGFGTNKTAIYTDNLSIGYAGTSPPSSGAIISGQVGVNVSTVASTARFNVGGTITATNNPSCIRVDAIFAPAASTSSYYQGIICTPTFVAASGQTTSGVNAAIYCSNFVTNNVGTLNTVAGIYVDTGGSTAGTISSAYGGFFQNPAFGNTKCAIYGDNLSIGYAATSPPSSGAIISGKLGVQTSTIDASAHFQIGNSSAGGTIQQNITSGTANLTIKTDLNSSSTIFTTNTNSLILGTNATGRILITSTPNISIFDATGSFGSGQQVIFIANRTAAPSSNPTGGGILYCESGALKYRGSGGTTTTIANA